MFPLIYYKNATVAVNVSYYSPSQKQAVLYLLNLCQYALFNENTVQFVHGIYVSIPYHDMDDIENWPNQSLFLIINNCLAAYTLPFL